MKYLLARLPITLALAFAVLFIALPIGAMFWETVQGEDGFTLRYWTEFLADPDDREALTKSALMGLCATTIAAILGGSFAWVTTSTDLPGARGLSVFGVAPLVIPPVLLAMSWSDFADMTGFYGCSLLLGISNAPFVHVLTVRGIRAFDGSAYESALLSRGRLGAERLLFRAALPEMLAGCLFAFVLIVSEHGTPEFLTVKGKTWITYAERVYGLWGRRALGISRDEFVAPIVAALPLIGLILVALIGALWLRSRAELRSDPKPLPVRRLGNARLPLAGIGIAYLLAGVVVPLVVMLRWSAGSTQDVEPMSIDIMSRSFQAAVGQDSKAIKGSFFNGVVVAGLLVLIAWPIARFAANRRGRLEGLTVLGISVPIVLFGIGHVRVWNSSLMNDWFYDVLDVNLYKSDLLVPLAFCARFLPFAALTLCSSTRRISPTLDESARVSGRGPWARIRRIHAPISLPAIGSAAYLGYVLALRELDLAALIPAGNDTIVRRVSNMVHFGGEEPGSALSLILLTGAVAPPLVHWIVTGRRMRSLH